MPVYLIRAGEHGPVKIGYAEDVPNRMVKMQADNHERLTVLRMFEGGAAEEAALHLRLAHLQFRGEWFWFSPLMLEDKFGLTELEYTPPQGHPVNDGRLAAWIIEHGTSVEGFARDIGVSASALYRYIAGERIPRAAIMARIIERTHGAIQPNDFFETAAA